MELSLEHLTASYGDDMEDWRWGEAHAVHAVHMKNRILGEIPVIGSWFDVNMPTGGDKETLKAGSFEVADPDRPFAQNHGAGYRVGYDLGDQTLADDGVDPLSRRMRGRHQPGVPALLGRQREPARGGGGEVAGGVVGEYRIFGTPTSILYANHCIILHFSMTNNHPRIPQSI